MKYADFHDLVAVLQDAEQRAHKMGLTKTGHAINKAVQAIGWEMADTLAAMTAQQEGP